MHSCAMEHLCTSHDFPSWEFTLASKKRRRGMCNRIIPFEFQFFTNLLLWEFFFLLLFQKYYFLYYVKRSRTQTCGPHVFYGLCGAEQVVAC